MFGVHITNAKVTGSNFQIKLNHIAIYFHYFPFFVEQKLVNGIDDNLDGFKLGFSHIFLLEKLSIPRDRGGINHLSLWFRISSICDW